MFVPVPIQHFLFNSRLIFRRFLVTYTQLACDELRALKAASTPYLLSAGKRAQGEEKKQDFVWFDLGGVCCLDVIGSCKGRDVA